MNAQLRLPIFSFLGTLLISSLSASSAQKEALERFGNFLHDNVESLEVRSLNDFYRIRGIPEKECEALSKELIPTNSVVEGLDPTNCRVNAYFIPEGVFDPHNHPLKFTSYIVKGGYSHSIYEQTDSLSEQDIIAEHSIIDTKTDTITHKGTAYLTKVADDSFVSGEYVVYDDTTQIHTIHHFEPDSLSINFISSSGDKKIDVFISHETPDRKVLSKSDVKQPIDKSLAKSIVQKCCNLLSQNN